VSTEAAVLFVILALAPLALVVLIAVLRGYSVDFHLERRRRRNSDDEQ
jgi:hypothetical protein